MNLLANTQIAKPGTSSQNGRECVEIGLNLLGQHLVIQRNDFLIEAAPDMGFEKNAPHEGIGRVEGAKDGC